MLADFDLAQLQPRNRGVIYPGVELGSFQRIDVEPAAKIGQCI
jgi:hypothetical protein